MSHYIFVWSDQFFLQKTIELKYLRKVFSYKTFMKFMITNNEFINLNFIMCKKEWQKKIQK